MRFSYRAMLCSFVVLLAWQLCAQDLAPRALPTGIFYAQGVKANVLFFDRKPASEKPWTKKLWIYERDQARGYGQQANRGTNTGAFNGYSAGGNARTNSARGQQSLEGRQNFGGGGARAGSRETGGGGRRR
jgi:hypothetical protein